MKNMGDKYIHSGQIITEDERTIERKLDNVQWKGFDGIRMVITTSNAIDGIINVSFF